jgi:hypothetical protein
VLGDPEYFKKKDEEDKKYQKLYSEVYNLFDQRQYARVAQLSKQAIIDFPEHELVPQFTYMITVSEGVSKDTATFISDLQKFIAKFPSTDVAGSAAILVSYLQSINPTASKTQKVEEAKALYSLDLTSEHYAAISLPKSVSTNQMMFNLTNFNIDNYSKEDLKVIKADIGQKWVLAITSFKDAAVAKEYINRVGVDRDIWRDVNSQGTSLFVISKVNFELLKKENKLESYLVFFKENYK